MAVNTSYLNTAGSPAGVSNQSQIAGSMASFVSISASGTLAASGTLTMSGQLTSTSTVNFNSLTNRFLSKVTTASLTSLTLSDGELTLGALSVSSVVIYYRSGNTTYRFIADAGAVL